MDTNQVEISSNKVITKSQKRKQKKVEKRKIRKEKRKAKQLLEQQQSGKLIEENHNGGLYSSEFTEKASVWYMNMILEKLFEMNDNPNRFLLFFRTIRSKIQTLVLKWSDEYPRDFAFYFLVELQDIYRDNKENGGLLLEYCKTKFKECGMIS